MVNLALGTPKLKIMDDASDALAIAIFAAGALRVDAWPFAHKRKSMDIRRTSAGSHGNISA